ncbi:UDP-N-acetylmuramoylalanyl-D-glutamyl-2,6-diami nopimelate--D-alanyl-D-alanine ligase [Formosa agariphila KMM 3901]|uniref:UDP-N-acetylmuramoyl-tripeptide--D-alanyl-D-alanine ligase n=1 Tax=Formosa agariphila (strain DSM 15362 / KCTC 12365 / LMG 23005 / KMM 3901 / M-2Alg 35-1) TaxID=1347342 RepID=T2KPR8_FORAG|nr:UDP-N-acetylmuramoyl-tripeptide--D-alanyl-D-alanine ligase [Formosa agariphila]CDF80493.1 UDP-N-acetylmuramoylalanyl-D-glutamyl-2,6-diami nopimelate--D-alanyl-D-alanine ligase [Formosa agariphila KMM 3901]
MNISDLHALFLECSTVCTDTRLVKENDLFFALTGEHFNGNKFAKKALESGASYAVIDDSEYQVEGETILVNNTLETLQQLAAFHRDYLNIPIIALTGSNGKTTSKELINVVLSQNYKTTATVGNLNNHIGVPLTLLSMHKDTELGIVEMGANHLKEIEFLCSIAKPNFGYITNFGKAHLEGFGSLEGVIQGKSELYTFLELTDGIAFINKKDEKQVELTSHIKRVTFGDQTTANKTTVNLESADPFVIANYNGFKIESQLIGSYNFTNISAAIAIGSYFKVSAKQIKTAIEGYTPTNNRSQIITKRSTKIILDAYNANPTSMKAALESFHILKDTNKIAIIGDMFELGATAADEHQHIIDLASTLNINKVYVVGKLFNAIEIKSNHIKAFDAFEDFKIHFSSLDIAKSTLLIKASRGMKLERILDLI